MYCSVSRMWCQAPALISLFKVHSNLLPYSITMIRQGALHANVTNYSSNLIQCYHRSMSWSYRGFRKSQHEFSIILLSIGARIIALLPSCLPLKATKVPRLTMMLSWRVKIVPQNLGLLSSRITCRVTIIVIITARCVAWSQWCRSEPTYKQHLKLNKESLPPCLAPILERQWSLTKA